MQSLTVIAVLLTSSLASVSVIVADATLNSVMESMTTHSSSAPASPVDVLAKKASSLSTNATLTEGAASMTPMPLDKKLSTTADQTVSYTEGEVNAVTGLMTLGHIYRGCGGARLGPYHR